MKKLIGQFLKFGIVGVICFAIDYVIGLVMMNGIVALLGESSFEMASLTGSAFGFIISVIVNYILSFKFVFKRKEDMNRKTEFIVFLVLSAIGLGINALIIWINTAPLFGFLSGCFTWVGGLFGMLFSADALRNLIYTFGKLVATAVVMVYNFITRKMFLEKKE